MRPSKRIPTHPGEVLLNDFLKPTGITQVAFAAHLGIPIQRLNQLIRGKRGVTPDTAWLLSQALGTTPDFWMNLQAAHDLAACRPTRKVQRLRLVEAVNRGLADVEAGRVVDNKDLDIDTLIAAGDKGSR